MKNRSTIARIPRSRIATFDTFEIGMKRHHVAALLEFDVTESRKRIKLSRRDGASISFNSWLIKVIGDTLAKHPEATAFKKNKREMLLFENVNISVLVEKTIAGKKVPLPLLITEVNRKSSSEIYEEMNRAVATEGSTDDIVLNRKSLWYESMY